MSTFADGYSRYLTYNFDYINKYTSFQKYFRNSIISLTDPNFMSKILISNIKDFPKYPYFLNAFARTDSINLVKIYNSSMDNVSNLLESMVGVSELSKKELYDSIPSSLDNFLAELTFQFAYVSTPTDLYNYDLIVKSFASEYQYRNFFSDLYTPLFHSTNQVDGETAGLEDKSFIYQYMLYSCLYNTISISHNIYSKLLKYLAYINKDSSPTNRIDQTTVLTGFQTFVANYKNNMSIDLAGIIGKSMYDFQNISQTMSTDLSIVISNKLSDGTTGFYKSFYNFYNPITSLSPINFVANNTARHLNSLISADILSKIYADGNIINQNATLTQVAFEEEVHSGFMNKISEAGLKNYVFLCFLYKFWPIKFLNVMQLSIKEYVEQSIKTIDDNSFEQLDYGNLFETFTGNYINYDNLQVFLDECVSPTPELVPTILIQHSTPAEDALFTFTPGSNEVLCSDVDSYNIIVVNQSIYESGDLDNCLVRVVEKIAPLTLKIDGNYTGMINTETTAYSDVRCEFVSKEPYIWCLNRASYDAINVHDYIYSAGDNDHPKDSRRISAHVIHKTDGDGDGPFKLCIENEYTGLISVYGEVNVYRYTFFPTNYLYEVSSNYQVAEFACVMYYVYLLEEFFKSTNYDKFIGELTEDIFTYLRNNGHVEYSFNWYNYHTVIDVYLKTYLRWKLVDQSKRCVLPLRINARYRFTNNVAAIHCIDANSYNLISDGDYIFSEDDTINNASQVLSHAIVGSSYVLILSSVYTGQTTVDGTYSIAYTISGIKTLLQYDDNGTITDSKFTFDPGSDIVQCSNSESYDTTVIGQSIYAVGDSAVYCARVVSKDIDNLRVTLDDVYTGIVNTESSAYSILFDVPLFDNVTANFAGKLYPRLLTNTAYDPNLNKSEIDQLVENYDIDIKIPASVDLKNYFDSFSTSKSFVKSMHQFSENLILSTVTRETIYSVLSDFVT